MNNVKILFLGCCLVASGQLLGVNSAVTDEFLDTARDKNNLDVAKDLDKLVKRGADTQAVDFEGKTAVHLAAGNGRTNTVAVLVGQFGLNPNLKDNGGFTPIMRAGFAGQTAMVTTLLNLGADLNIPDNSGKTFMDYATATSGLKFNPSVQNAYAQYVERLRKEKNEERKAQADKHAHEGLSTDGLPVGGRYMGRPAQAALPESAQYY
ncbi:MAG TPA: ankyrin repeat domain-containing protein [Candidatus Limnocylindria bacterium]|nr:ankyrin repeat domain-containing protein [Candidatus Limnocylindria bacterium]